jgi:hypothetical protein
MKNKIKTLELKEICGYLPYDLKYLNCDDAIDTVDFCNVGNAVRYLQTEDRDEDDEWLQSQKITPILRPLSDLYKTITHGGKEIIPLVELAKISYPAVHNWDYVKGDNYSFSYLDNMRFHYNDEECAFFIIGYDHSIDIAFRQYQLFDYLNELKIDYRGLIDAGLAVSVYDLEENPYK